MIFVSWSRERSKLLLRNYFPLTIFTKCFIVDVWICLEFWICQTSEHTGVLNVPGFRIYQGSEYVSYFEYVRVQDIPRLWICQGYTGFWIYLNNSWICLIMPECAEICLNGFCFTFTHWNSLSKGTIIRFPGKKENIYL